VIKAYLRSGICWKPQPLKKGIEQGIVEEIKKKYGEYHL
jgi:hypothetical protein